MQKVTTIKHGGKIYEVRDPDVKTVGKSHFRRGHVPYSVDFAREWNRREHFFERA